MLLILLHSKLLHLIVYVCINLGGKYKDREIVINQIWILVSQ